MTARLKVFCSEIDTDLDRVREAFKDASDGSSEGGAIITPAETPEDLSQAGWMVVSVELSEELCAEQSLGAQLETVTGLFARVLNESVLGLVVDSSPGEARACYHSPGMFPRSTEGESVHVIRQAASWIEADPNLLVDYFNAHGPRSELSARVDLSDVQTEKSEGEPTSAKDEDDLFVEAKLKLAREWMERYLHSRK